MSGPGRDGEFERVTLRCGARAVRHLGHGEVMHPSVGPWTEANQLYVHQPRLAELLARSEGAPVRILDVGLGAAANAVAALTCAARLGRERRPLELVSLERDLSPLRLALADPEGFPYLVPWRSALEAVMTHGRWSSQGLRWRLLFGDAREELARLAERFELVYFDPFSPEHNPELWRVEALARVHAVCDAETRLITYSAATPTRVTLLLAGFYVGAGAPIGTKAETTVASTRLELLDRPLDKRWLERWRRSSARAPHGETLSPSHETALLAHPQWRIVGP